LSCDEAYLRFIEDPLRYQEDFMFMGGGAFLYYFPVLERYLRAYRVGVGPGDENESCAAVIAGGVSVQLLAAGTSGALDPLIERIRGLAEEVRAHADLLAADLEERGRIDSCWQILQIQLPRSSGGGHPR
jgi:hypothetical protein